MLTGEPPFTGTTPQSVIAKRFAGPAPSVAALRDTIPDWLDAVVARALARSPADRFPTAKAFAKALSAPTTATARATLPSTGRWRWAGVAALLVAGIGAVAAWLASDAPDRDRDPRGRGMGHRNRDSDHPHVGRQRALGLGLRPRVARERHPPPRHGAGELVADHLRHRDDPVGAGGRPGVLEALRDAGRSRDPARHDAAPSRPDPVAALENSGWRRPATARSSVAIWPAFAARAPFVLRQRHRPRRRNGAGRQAARPTSICRGLEHLDPLRLSDYLIGRHEVTNKAFKQFVDSGGYRRRELWTHPFVLKGRELPWSEAMARFTDKTGRPGPAGWEAGTYPEGQADHPVTGRELVRSGGVRGVRRGRPADHLSLEQGRLHLGRLLVSCPRAISAGRGWHPWADTRASGPSGPSTWPATRGSGASTRPVSSATSWVAAGTIRPTRSTTRTPRIPSIAPPTNGFRLVKYLSDQPATARRPIVRLFRDFSKERPVPDQVFAAYRRMYDYDRTRLNAVVDTARGGDRRLGPREDLLRCRLQPRADGGVPVPPQARQASLSDDRVLSRVERDP